MMLVNKIFKQRFLNNNIKVRYKRNKKQKGNIVITYYIGSKYISFYNLDKIRYSFNSFINQNLYYFSELEYYNEYGFIHNDINKPGRIHYYNLKFTNDSDKICYIEYYKHGQKIYNL